MASDKDINECPKEPSSNYLDHHKLYWGVHSQKWCFWYEEHEIQPNVFNLPRSGEEGMSVDWDKHCSTPQESFKYKQNPKHYRIMEITVKGLKSQNSKLKSPLEVEHKPWKEDNRILNCAHSIILNFPPKNEKNVILNNDLVHIRALLITLPECNWAIPPSEKEEVCEENSN